MKTFFTIVALLIAFNVLAQKQNINDKLLDAVKGSRLSAVNSALTEGAEVNAKDLKGVSALMYAAFTGNLDIAICLLDKGANLKAKANDGATALSIACLQGNIGVINLLLRRGADVKSKDSDVGRALGLAAKHGHKEVIGLLLESGADVNSKNAGNNGATPLIIAASDGYTKIVELLLERFHK